MQQFHQQRIQQHLSDLKSVLKLTPEQQDAWQSFAEAMAQHGAMQMAGPGAMGQQSPAEGATDYFDSRVAFMESRLEAMKALDQAMETFYDSLNPQQQATLDGYWSGRRGMMSW